MATPADGPLVWLPPPHTTVEQWTAAAVSFVAEHDWMFRCHVVDFITHDHWQHVPADWRGPLLGCTTAELCQLPTGRCPDRATTTSDAWPPSLRDFFAAASALALPRAPGSESGEIVQALLQRLGRARPGSRASAPAAPAQPAAVSSAAMPTVAGTSRLVESAMWRGVKQKKRHEIERLGPLVAALCASLDCSMAVDFGAGQGYLSQLLHFQHGLAVLGIDSSDHQTHGATSRADRLRQAAAAGPSPSKASKPTRPSRASWAARRPMTADEQPVAEASESIATEPASEPGAAALDLEHCLGCGSDGGGDGGEWAGLKACTLCAAAAFCSKECQRKAWKAGHKAVCLANKRQQTAADVTGTAAGTADGVSSDPKPSGSYSAVTCLLDARLTRLQSVVAAAGPPFGAGLPYVLLGLHTCGDLTPSMLRVFNAAPAPAAGGAVPPPIARRPTQPCTQLCVATLSSAAFCRQAQQPW